MHCRRLGQTKVYSFRRTARTELFCWPILVPMAARNSRWRTPCNWIGPRAKRMCVKHTKWRDKHVPIVLHINLLSLIPLTNSTSPNRLNWSKFYDNFEHSSINSKFSIEIWFLFETEIVCRKCFLKTLRKWTLPHSQISVAVKLTVSSKKWQKIISKTCCHRDR